MNWQLLLCIPLPSWAGRHRSAPIFGWAQCSKTVQYGKTSRHILDQKVSNERYRYPLSIGTVACPKRQTSVLNSKSTFLGCFPTKLDKIWRVPRSSQGPSSLRISSTLVGKQQRKMDLLFRTDVCRLGQATVPYNPILIEWFGHSDPAKLGDFWWFSTFLPVLEICIQILIFKFTPFKDGTTLRLETKAKWP